jgi:hypothetical protein
LCGDEGGEGVARRKAWRQTRRQRDGALGDLFCRPYGAEWKMDPGGPRACAAGLLFVAATRLGCGAEVFREEASPREGVEAR